MKTALITVATGAAYRDYAKGMFASARKFFPVHDPIVFTDEPSEFFQHAFYTEAKGYPRETLMRYHTMLMVEDFLRTYEQIFYVDADMEFVSAVGEEIFSSGITATLHPGFVGKTGSPEQRPKSAAFTLKNDAYYCGGFQGGNANAYLNAARKMSAGISQDESNGIMAVWHDESHWNCLLAKQPPTTILSPRYCYPEDYDGRYGWVSEPTLVALDKRKRGNHPRFS